MPKGVVSWSVYESFRLGEQEAGMARNAFDTFIPIGSDSPARTRIINDFFDLISAIAAHGKLNGLPGRKLSRLAGWWAFEHSDGGKGFEGGYKSWTAAADASSHLFFAYLRSLSPDVDPSMNVIERIPRSLQALLAQTEYPPETPTLLQRTTPRVVMVVDQVSPSPFSLLRRAKHFEYRQSDRILKDYSDFEDPVDALTDECKRVLYAIASTNSSGVARSRHGLAKPEESWSSFTSTGFSDINADLPSTPALSNGNGFDSSGGRLSPRARNLAVDRPTTPSWGDFLSSGFHDEASKSPSTMLLPPDKVLPPIASRTQTPSIMSGTDIDEDVTPGELAAITSIELDDSFWWVWMTSLAGEEPNDRKAVFGRCALIETTILNGKWLIMEEQVKGASPDPLEGAQVVEKKSRFSFSRRSKLGRGKSTNKKQTAPPVPQLPDTNAKANRMTIDVGQQAKIKAAAAELARKKDAALVSPTRRGRQEEGVATKTNSTFTMGLQSEAGPAMKWANTYDKDTIRSAYLGSNLAGTGQGVSTESLINGSSTNLAPTLTPLHEERPVEPEYAPTPEPLAAPTAEIAPTPAYDPSSKELGVPTTGEHPALRQHEDEEYDIVSPQEAKESNAAVIAAKMALEGRAVSPESTRSSKLMKKQQPSGQSGLKKFFSRNKDKSKRQSTDINPGAMSAAHDAAMGRKLVSLRQNPGPAAAAVAPVAAVEPQLHEPELVAPVMPASQGQFNGSTAGLSRVDSEDQRHADDAFSRFDQGPLDDMPAAAARESVDYHSDAAEPPTIARYSPRNPQPQRFAPPAVPVSAPQSAGSQYSTTHERMASIDDIPSEMTLEDHKEAPAAPLTTADTSKDRWERIRENAARRAANAKANDDTSATSNRVTESGKTDDGDTSGEESESRFQSRFQC